MKQCSTKGGGPIKQNSPISAITVYEDFRAMTSISIFIRGSRRPAEIIIAAERADQYVGKQMLVDTE